MQNCPDWPAKAESFYWAFLCNNYNHPEQKTCRKDDGVITSYSIHYTKLYDAKVVVENPEPGRLYKVEYTLYEDNSEVSNYTSDYFESEIVLTDLLYDDLLIV